jgi:phage major head subunit gpT-like protein
MQITPASLKALNTTFSAHFQGGIASVQSTFETIAMTVSSTSKDNTYGWMKDMPGLREWIGDRVLNNIAADSYKIPNKTYEQTIAVSRDDIDDDNLGTYNMRFAMFGENAARHPNEMVWGLFRKGFTETCFDGQYYFDTDHPVILENGTIGSQSNFTAGAGVPWYIIADSGVIKPMIYQTRREPVFVAKDNPDDDNVFMKNQFLYGIDKRCGVGFGFWQNAHASRADLTPENFTAAYTAMMSLKGDNGKLLAIRPTKLIVPPSLMDKAKKVLEADMVAQGNAGVSSTTKGLCTVVVEPYLA